MWSAVGENIVVLPFDDGFDQVGFVSEVVINLRLANGGRADHVVDGGSSDTVGEDESRGGLDDVLASVSTLGRRRDSSSRIGTDHWVAPHRMYLIVHFSSLKLDSQYLNDFSPIDGGPFDDRGTGC